MCARYGELSTSASQLTAEPIPADPVFDRYWWLYSLCRERLFADHTEAIAEAIEPLFEAQPGLRLLELGCGPGFYSRRLAARFPSLQATGIDTSGRLLHYAREQATRANLPNCRFLQADAHNLSASLEIADAVIASRFFLILSERARVFRAVFDALRPGGVFFVAEPISPTRTAVPLWLMRAADLLTGRRHCSRPVHCRVLGPAEFEQLIGSEPWHGVRIWQDKRYRYALCEKAA